MNNEFGSRSLRWVFGAIGVLAAAALACNLLRTPGAGSRFDASVAVNPGTEPIPVSLTLDQGHAASAEIGPDGGTLSATSADGTRFTLEVPPNALVETVQVSMIPITKMEGIPWGSDTVDAVQLEPDGQTFYSYVNLTIQPLVDLPANQVIPVGASGPGHDLYMPIIDPKSTALVLELDHFSSAGATKGLLADTEPWRQRLGGDVETRLQSIMGREIAQARQNLASGNQAPLFDPEFLAWFITTWKKEVLQPRLDAAGESCAAGRLAIETVLKMYRVQALLGDETDLGANVSDLLPTVGRVCIKEEYELCRDQHIVHRILPVLIGLARQDELLGMHDLEQAATHTSDMDQVEVEGWDLARKCLQFELQFESSATLGTGDGSFTSKVEANVKIQLDPTGQQQLELKGSGSLDNTQYDFNPNLCTATGITGGGWFQVFQVTWVDAPPDSGHPYGHVTAIHLTFDPGNTSESAKVSCSGAAPVTVPPSPMWTMAFEALHMDDLTGTPGGQAPPLDLGSILSGTGIGGLPGLPGAPGASSSSAAGQDSGQGSEQGSGMTFTAKEWAVRGGELFAQKEWKTEVNMTTVGNEEGSFKLYHKPQ